MLRIPQRNVMILHYFLLALFGALPAFADTLTTAPVVPHKVIRSLPHDPEAFTQGLTIGDGVLYEGTGSFAEQRSTLSKITLATGNVQAMTTLDSKLFCEGIALVGDRLYQLTWKNQQVLVYDRQSLKLLHTMSFQSLGWGLTFDGTHLIRSDGSSTLYLHEVETFAEVGRIEVKDGGEPVKGLNELEMVEGRLFANIWKTDNIAIIDPTNGQVTGSLNLSALPHPANWKKNNAFLNGIAYDQNSGRLYVTGKLWPQLFEIKLLW